MKVKGLDGKEHVWTLSSSSLKDDSRSGLHLKARQLLNELFPYDKIYEDVTLPGSNRQTRNSTLYGDFYIPIRSIMIEVQGNQHNEYVKFFHKTKHNFYKSLQRDKDKAEWCNINGITLIKLNHDQTVDQWRKCINEA